MGNDNVKLSRSSSISSCGYMDAHLNDDSINDLNIIYMSKKYSNTINSSTNNPATNTINYGFQLNPDNNNNNNKNFFLNPNYSHANRSNSMKVNTNIGYKYSAEIYKFKESDLQAINEDNIDLYKISDGYICLYLTNYFTNNPKYTIYFAINAFNQNLERIANFKLIYPGTKIYFETKLFCRFMDINNEYWGVKFETNSDSESFQRHIRMTIKDFTSTYNNRSSHRSVSSRIPTKNRLSLTSLTDVKNRKYKYVLDDKSEFYLNNTIREVDNTKQSVALDDKASSTTTTPRSKNLTPELVLPPPPPLPPTPPPPLLPQHSSSLPHSKSQSAIQQQTTKLGSLSFHHNKTANNFIANKILNKTKSQRFTNDNSKLNKKPPKCSNNNFILRKSDSNIYKNNEYTLNTQQEDNENDENETMQQQNFLSSSVLLHQQQHQHQQSQESQPFTVPRSRSDINILKVLNTNFNYSRNLSAYNPDNSKHASDFEINTTTNTITTSTTVTININGNNNNNQIITSKSPSLNSILDTHLPPYPEETDFVENDQKPPQHQNDTTINKTTIQQSLSYNSLYYQTNNTENSTELNTNNNSTVVTRQGLNNHSKKLFRGSDYTDSGIGHGSLLDTNSHRSSIISQGSIDSGTQSNTSSNINPTLHCSNYIRDLSNNNTNGKKYFKNTNKSKIVNARNLMSLKGNTLLNNFFSSNHSNLGSNSYLNFNNNSNNESDSNGNETLSHSFNNLNKLSKEQNLFTDLNLLISDDELVSNDNDENKNNEEYDDEQHDSCLENESPTEYSGGSLLKEYEQGQYGTQNANDLSTLVTRKAGWLNIKNWLINTRGKLELASKRTWKKYWVALKGCNLCLFVESNDMNENYAPKFLINIDGCLVQSLPEHPRKDNIFCLSTSIGQVFLFQAQSQNELDNWIHIINTVCAYSFSKNLKKENVLKEINKECQLIEKNIEIESKMKKMAELQLNITSDQKSKEAVNKQILQWERNLEKLNVNLYRYKCYMASINSSEVPNPKTLLAHASKYSKIFLTKLGAFTVCTLHAHNVNKNILISSKTTNNNTSATNSNNMNSANLLNNNVNNENKFKNSSESEFYDAQIYCTPRTPFAEQNEKLSLNRQSKFSSTMKEKVDSNENLKNNNDFVFDIEKKTFKIEAKNEFTKRPCHIEFKPKINENRIIKILLPNKEYFKINANECVTIKQLLEILCNRMRYDSRDYFFIYNDITLSYSITDLNTIISDHLFNGLELHKKQLYSVEFHMSMYEAGFDIEAELDNDDDTSNRDDKVRVFVSQVKENSEASDKGIKFGDEIVIINGNLIETLDMDKIYYHLNADETLRLTLKTARSRNEIENQNLAQTTRSLKSPTMGTMKSADQLAITEAIISELICPPPPSCSSYKLNNQSIDALIIPAPEKAEIKLTGNEQKVPTLNETKLKRQNAKATLNNPDGTVDSISSLLQECERVNIMCRMETEFIEPTEETTASGRVKPLTNAQKLRKVIFELVETEKNYVKDLSCMIERYLEPLKQESFLSQDDIESLFGNIQEILEFQKLFLKSLEQAIETDILTYNSTSQFRSTLFSLGGSFLYYGNHFKVYSSFCASHSKAQKLLKPENNPKLEQFLLARNPKQQHSSSLESYLIKPIQRILKYPLLLKQLLNFVESEAEEYQHLNDALKCMQTVAEQINEMQKIFEEYGCFFETVMKKFKNDRFMRLDLSPNHLLLYGQVEWLNISEEVEKYNKKHTYETLCFVFDSGAMLLCIENKNKILKKKDPKQNKNACFLTFIPVMELQVRSKIEQNSLKLYMWDLIHMHTSVGGSPYKIYTLANRFEDTRTMFVKRIQGQIRESIRQIPVRRNLGQSLSNPVASSASSTSSASSSSSSATLSSSNRPSSAHLNRYSCLSDETNLTTNKTSPESLNNLPSPKSVPESPVWKPRLLSQYSQDSIISNEENKQSRTSSVKRHIQFKLPKNTYSNDYPYHSNIESYLIMTANNESTDC